MKINELPRCRRCGREIAVIEWGVYRKAIVDPDAIWVVPDEEGEDFMRVDGSKIRGRESPYSAKECGEPAYRLHRRSCGVTE